MIDSMMPSSSQSVKHESATVLFFRRRTAKCVDKHLGLWLNSDRCLEMITTRFWHKLPTRRLPASRFVVDLSSIPFPSFPEPTLRVTHSL